MPDESWLRAVPFGLVMFLGTVFGVVTRAWRKRAARASFPELGKRLGLGYAPADTPGAAGIVKGTYEGFAARIEADARSRVVLTLPQTPALDLRNYERWVRLPKGLTPFPWSDRSLNAWLRTRLASVDVAAAAGSDAELAGLLHEVRQDPALREFTLAEGRIEMVFDYGVRGLFPTDAADRALALAVRLARRVESLPQAVETQLQPESSS